MMSYLIYILLSLFLFTACDGGHDEEGGSARVLPIHIRIKTTEGPQQRTPGDPGDVEKFPLPSVAYIYVLANSAADGKGASLLQTIDGAANRGKVDLNDALWEQDANDPSIYHYGGALNISLWHMTQSAKVYVAVADRAIPGIDLPQAPDDIVSLTYHPSQVDGGANEFMKNLYSTPYNKPVSADDATYYGTVKDLNTNTPSVNVMLYHVAARLDLKWNVGEERRKTFALGTLSVSNLPDECYLFRPTENQLPAGDGYSEAVVSSFSATTAWSGRRAVYVPQVKQVNDGTSAFPVTLSYTNAAQEDADEATHSELFAFENAIYTTWFNVEADFVDKNE